MRINSFVLLVCSLLVLNACSKSEDTTTAEQQSAAPTQTTIPQQQTSQPSAPASASELPKRGKVVKAMHAGGYTYMQVEDKGKQFWIAATMMNVRRNDNVTWTDAAMMRNFTSSTLHRTFDEILFVTSAEIEQ
ncbi:hypothetical protein [Kaarinaea lacus]